MILKLKPTNTFIRFMIIGIANTIIGLGITFLFLHLIGAAYWAATFIGNSIGAVMGYVLNRTFTFQSKRPFKESFWRYTLVIISCYFLSYGISEQMTKLVPNFYDELRQDLAVLLGACLYTITNFFGQKIIVFRN